jgi:lipopolysaccharide export system protein LptA
MTLTLTSLNVQVVSQARSNKQKWRNNLIGSGRYDFMAVLMIIGLFMLFLPVAATSETLPGLGDSPGTMLNITSDKLLSDRNSQYVLFSGNVVAVYGDKTISSDTLKVIYLAAPTDQSGLNGGKIDKIIATGNVVIKFDDKTAYCDQAVYTQETQTIQLTGKDARIKSDDNYITGEKITVRQLTGQVTVDGNPEKRVNAVFTPGKDSSKTIENQGDEKPK